MLFHVKLPLTIDRYNNNEKRVYLRALEHLFRARFEKKHIVYISPEDFPRISLLGKLSADAADVAVWTRDRSSEIDGLRKTVACYTVLEPMGVGKVEIAGAQRIIHEDLRHFSDSAFTQRAILLCENKKDSEFYGLMANVLAHKLGLNTILADLDLRGGGGTEIAVEYAQQVSQGYVVLAIADGDRLCPNQPILADSPAGLLLAVPVQHGFQLALHLTSRNIENVVSDELWWSSLKKDHAKLITTEFDRYRDLLHDPSWRSHAQLKDDGQRLFEIKALPPGSPCWQQWNKYAVDLNRDRCVRTVPCVVKDDCKCKVFIGLGDKAHKKVMTWLRTNFRTPRKSYDLFQWSLAVEPQIAAMVLAWGCTDGRTIGSGS